MNAQLVVLGASGKSLVTITAGLPTVPLKFHATAPYGFVSELKLSPAMTEVCARAAVVKPLIAAIKNIVRIIFLIGFVFLLFVMGSAQCTILS